ncbi:MAG: tetratricopeptide repeat protein [Patescibacteria group bacterium]|jgi:tetratricopeptide (TPR) repeat protein
MTKKKSQLLFKKSKSLTLAKAIVSGDFKHPHTKTAYTVLFILLGFISLYTGWWWFKRNDHVQIIVPPKVSNDLKTPNVSAIIKQQEKLDISKKTPQELMSYYYLLGSNYIKNGQVDKAKEALEKSLSYGEYAFTYQELGQLYINLGDKVKALEMYKKSVYLHQKNPNQISPTQMNYLNIIIYELESEKNRTIHPSEVEP